MTLKKTNKKKKQNEYKQIKQKNWKKIKKKSYWLRVRVSSKSDSKNC